MANELSNLKPPAGSRRKAMRVGRGEGSGKGKTSGRGSKGQRARNTVRRGFEGGQMPLHRRLAKQGFKNPFSKDFATVRLDAIARKFSEGDVVDIEALVASGLVRKVGKHGVKVLGNGEIDFAVTVRATRFSQSAADKIRAAGGAAEEV